MPECKLLDGRKCHYSAAFPLDSKVDIPKCLKFIGIGRVFKVKGMYMMDRDILKFYVKKRGVR